MKSLLIIVALTSSIVAQAQKAFTPTRSFTISGEVKTPATIQIADLKKWKTVDIGPVTITNHLGEKKSEYKSMKGVLLKDVLSTVEFNAEAPKVLSEYYIMCKANDNYLVVFSWNELFNTATGNTVYIVTERDGKPIEQMDDAILMISSKDFKTGRRHVKSLSSIQVRRAK